MHPQSDHFLVVRAIEDADPAALGKRQPMTMQPTELDLLRGRSIEVGHPEALRIDTGRDALDRAVLAGRVHALEHEQEGTSILGVEQLLPRC